VAWVIILVVVGLALAPLLHFLPSKGQRRIARMREAAALGGLFVEFRAVPEEPAAPGAGPRPIYYGKRLPPPRRGEYRRGAWLREGADWRGSPRRLAVPAVLRELPETVLGAGVDGGSCGIYWREEGTEVDVQRICDILERWAVNLGSEATLRP
jgi:hypothetical protein